MFLVLFSASTLAVVAGIAWVTGTTQGARWLLDQISQRTALEISTERLEGTLGRDLRVHGLTVSWPGGNAQIKNMRLRWRPILLLSCRFVITGLSVDDVTIQDNAPEEKKQPGLSMANGEPPFHIPICQDRSFSCRPAAIPET